MIVMIKTIKVNMEVAAENPGFKKAEKSRWINPEQSGQGGEIIYFNTAKDPESECLIFFTCQFQMSKVFL